MSSVISYGSTFCPVKLNNPLMGTETIRHNRNQINGGIDLVKLNNPLMGTETMQ